MQAHQVEEAERDVLAGFRLRTAAVARNAAWITLAGIFALTAPHHSPGHLGTHMLLWVLLGAAAIANSLTYLPAFSRLIQSSRGAWPFAAWTLLLLLFDGANVFLSHDAQHQVYLIYVPVLLFAAWTLEPPMAAGAGLLAIGTALGAVAINGGLTSDVAAGATATFVVVTVLGMYFASEQRREVVASARRKREAERRGVELAALHERSVALNDELQRTVGKVIRAQEEERRRIGRELHDEAVQMLSAAAVRVGGLEQRVPARQRWLRDALAELRTIITDALWEMRKIIIDLRPSDLDDLGLAPAVSAYARNRLTDAGVTVELRVETPRRRYPGTVETAVFRIAQEAVNNIARHAQAHHAALSFRECEGTILLRVDDDGVGFDPAAVKANGNGEGLGLLGMRERAALLGGAVEVTSDTGGGTSVVARIPVPVEAVS